MGSGVAGNVQHSRSTQRNGIVENERNEVLLRRANLYPVHDGLYDAQFGSGYFEESPLYCVIS